ncbi:MAG TPA: hypothetical protein PLL92_11480, partial [Alicycliphilus sp.]|nr:hypothetical protein [Alicycliphilus sp.]
EKYRFRQSDTYRHESPNPPMQIPLNSFLSSASAHATTHQPWLKWNVRDHRIVEIDFRKNVSAAP